MYLPYGQLQDRSHDSSRDQNNSPKAACGPAVQKTDQHTVAEAALELDIHATAEEEEEGFYKFLPANTADRLCQLWQSCSNHHEI